MQRLILYKHPNNTDVAFEVLKKFHITQGNRWSMKVRWWNVCGASYGRRPYCMNITERIKISDAKFKEFKPFIPGESNEI